MNENATYYKRNVQWCLRVALAWWKQYQLDKQHLFALDQWHWFMDRAKWNYKQYQKWLVR